MNLKYTNIILLISLIFIPNVKSAETLFLYKGTFNRSINIEELDKFKDKKIPSQKLKNIMKITNQNEKDLFNILSYEIDVPIKSSS